ncbi:MAG: hypothetical protein JO266_05285, partial [Acidobacteria bacterium]|nr:hypothetical protein [Acidobacteriota bacterium]
MEKHPTISLWLDRPWRVGTVILRKPGRRPRIFRGWKWIEEGQRREIRSTYDLAVVGQVFEATKEHVEEAMERREGVGHDSPLAADSSDNACCAACRDHSGAESPHHRPGSWKPIRAAGTEVERDFNFYPGGQRRARPLDWQEYTAGSWGIVKRFPRGPITRYYPLQLPAESGPAIKWPRAIAAGLSNR